MDIQRISHDSLFACIIVSVLHCRQYVLEEERRHIRTHCMFHPLGYCSCHNGVFERNHVCHCFWNILCRFRVLVLPIQVLVFKNEAWKEVDKGRSSRIRMHDIGCCFHLLDVFVCGNYKSVIV